MNIFKSNPFYMKVSGQYALFTDPMTKGGGEKFTYQVPSYQALKGIVEACYWKPTFYYVIDSVKIMKPIKTETKGILSPLKDGKKDLNYHTYLKDVEYLIKFHFRWNDNRQDLDYDRDEKKHEQILLRSMKRGGRRDIFLGTRECIGHIERMREEDFENGKSPYDGESISLGIMFHSFTYPDEAYSVDTEESLTSNFSPISMINGRIDFILPKECTIKHKLGNYSIKKFDKNNLIGADDLLNAYEKEGVIQDELDECTSRDI
ncbi:MAG: type I-C CRISPR-associated protein Cas5c [Tissierellaceae bacterium]|nr:type I-C CRISPR-associated protein Cas5c [Tissierellaceae bacterium]